MQAGHSAARVGYQLYGQDVIRANEVDHGLKMLRHRIPLQSHRPALQRIGHVVVALGRGQVGYARAERLAPAGKSGEIVRLHRADNHHLFGLEVVFVQIDRRAKGIDAHFDHRRFVARVMVPDVIRHARKIPAEDCLKMFDRRCLVGAGRNAIRGSFNQIGIELVEPFEHAGCRRVPVPVIDEKQRVTMGREERVRFGRGEARLKIGKGYLRAGFGRCEGIDNRRGRYWNLQFPLTICQCYIHVLGILILCAIRSHTFSPEKELNLLRGVLVRIGRMHRILLDIIADFETNRPARRLLGVGCPD